MTTLELVQGIVFLVVLGLITRGAVRTQVPKQSKRVASPEILGLLPTPRESQEARETTTT